MTANETDTAAKLTRNETQVWGMINSSWSVDAAELHKLFCAVTDEDRDTYGEAADAHVLSIEDINAALDSLEAKGMINRSKTEPRGARP